MKYHKKFLGLLLIVLLSIFATKGSSEKKIKPEINKVTEVTQKRKKVVKSSPKLKLVEKKKNKEDNRETYQDYSLEDLKEELRYKLNLPDTSDIEIVPEIRNGKKGFRIDIFHNRS